MDAQQGVPDGGIFFREESSAYSYMWDRSFNRDGSVKHELSAWITDDGVLVMPSEGTAADGTYKKNGPRERMLSSDQGNKG